MLVDPMAIEQKRERGPYASGTARREKILDATMDLLAEVGYHGMSLRDVARRVGISHPGVIYHFPSKEALLMSVITRYEEQLGVDMKQMEQYVALDVFDGLIKLSAQMEEEPMLVEVETMMLVEATSALHPAHAHFASRNDQMDKVLSRAWSMLQVEGKVGKSEDPQLLAKSLKSLWYGLMIMWLYDRKTNMPVALARSITQTVSPEYAPQFKAHFVKQGWDF